MADNGVDLTKLREGIAERKKEISERNEALGESTGVKTKQSGDIFLKELMHSASTGVETNASITVKKVDKLSEAMQVAKKTGTAVDPNLLNHVPATSTTPSVGQANNNVNNRTTATQVARMEEANRIKNNNNQPAFVNNNIGMADTMSQYMNIPPVGAPMNNNGMLNEQQMINQFGNNAPNAMIVEQVNNVATQMLNENFGSLYAEAMKNNIIESYKAEVIKSAIEENRAFIKEMVVETILELQKRNQSKNQ